MTKTILLIKSSSLGDVLHALPAVTDAVRHCPDIRFHWLVEEAFAEVPSWHPAVQRVISFPWRRWRKNLFKRTTGIEISRFVTALRECDYDVVLDAQGLLKSAIPTFLARGKRWGMDWHSAREPLAALFYQHLVAVSPNLHAVERVRLLFGAALGYIPPPTPPEHGLDLERIFTGRGALYAEFDREPYSVFLHGTTWISKHWPESHWLALAAWVGAKNRIVLPWGNAEEKAWAVSLAQRLPNRCLVAPKTDLAGLSALLVKARAVVAVDSGPAHLAAALGVPAVCLYGPTHPAHIGTMSVYHHHLRGECPRAPCRKKICPIAAGASAVPACLAAIRPEKVFQVLQDLL